MTNDGTVEQRLASMERSNRRWRMGALVLGAALAGSVMIGQAQTTGDTPGTRVEGFSVAMDQRGGVSYFRLMDDGYVQTLDTSRGDRWFWRRIRNWPEPK